MVVNYLVLHDFNQFSSTIKILLCLELWQAIRYKIDLMPHKTRHLKTISWRGFMIFQFLVKKPINIKD